MQTRQRRYAQVHFTLGELDPDATILRPTTLRDVEAGHDLHTADDSRLILPADARHLAQDAIEAVPHAKLSGERLEVHVTGTGAQRIEERDVHEPDHRLLFRQCAEVIERLVVTLARPDGQRGICRCLTLGGEQGCLDLAHRMLHELDRTLEQAAQFIEDGGIGHTADGQDERATVIHAQRKHGVLLEVSRRQASREHADGGIAQVARRRWRIVVQHGHGFFTGAVGGRASVRASPGSGLRVRWRARSNSASASASLRTM